MALAAALDTLGHSLFSFEPHPVWVESVEIAASTIQQQSDSPLQFLFLSYQDRIANSQIQRYMRRVFQINDESHIEDNSHSLHELSPDSEQIAFHRCVIYRQGKTLDRLDAANIRALKRETGLEQQKISDRITLELLIDDLRVGDTVDIEATTTEYVGAHSLYGRFYLSTARLGWGVPVAEMLNRVVNDGVLTITLQRKDTDTGTDTSWQLAPGKIDTWHKKDLPLLQQPNYLPYWYWPDSLVAATTQSWTDVSAYLFQQNDKHGVLDNVLDSEQIDEIEGIDWKDNSLENVTRVVRFVQDNIRYRAESNGIHTHTPKCVSETLRRRTGDCKDKSALLVVLLAKIGVNAELALVSTDLKDSINSLPPSPYWFNHMIVRVQHEDQHYIVDPTLQKQGGSLNRQARLNYRLCLPLSAECSGLVEVPRDDSVLLYERSDEFDLRFDTLDQCTLRVERTFYQERADNMRFHLASKIKSQLEESYLVYAKEEFRLDLLPAVPYHIIEDNKTDNILRTEEVYQLQGNIEDLEPRTISFSSDAHEDFAMPTRDTHPVVTGETGVSRHTVVAHYGSPPGRIKDRFEEKNPLFEYQDRLETEGNSITCFTEFRALADCATADQVSHCRKAVAKLQNRSRTNLPLTLHLETKTSFTDHAWYLYPLVFWVMCMVASKNDWFQYPPVTIGFIAGAGILLAMRFKPQWFGKT